MAQPEKHEQLIRLEEHQQWILPNGSPVGYDERYNGLELVQWKKPTDKRPWGYYASFKIGAEWIDSKEALVVTAKRGMNDIDFLALFMTCFASDLALDSFAEIYRIDPDKPMIPAPVLSSIVSPLIVVHFISVVNRIKTLKRGYVSHHENLKKIKGHIRMLKNERLNIATKRYDRIYCAYDEYSVDIPANRLLKKALLFSRAMIDRMGGQNRSHAKLKLWITKTLKRFENVSDEVDMRSVGLIRSHKLFNEYSEALRLAKTILKHFDYSINKAGLFDNKVPPFVLDMSLLYEHYVYGLLHEAYHDKIAYQFNGATGYPDFLYKSADFKAILDTKYIPRYQKGDLDNDVIRQLSGYGRDLSVLRHLGYSDLEAAAPTPSVPCIILYPKEGGAYNPFKSRSLDQLCTDTKPLKKLSMFYKLGVPVPMLRK